MHSLTSHRLQLLPLRRTDLELLIVDRSRLEEALGLATSSLEISAENFLNELMESIPAFVLPKMAAHPDDWRWCTHWLVVHRELNLTIGGIGVAGPPHPELSPDPTTGLDVGQTFLGYFIDQKFEGQGYMTEAVACFLDWLFRDDRLQAVIADTLVGPNASQQVLIRNGFTPVGAVEEGLRWKKSRL